MTTKFGRYDIGAKIAEGGMATIHLGRLRGARGFARTVAIKMLKAEGVRDSNFVDMFVDEATLVAKLAHPNIVQIYELGLEEGQLFIAMEMLFGQSLAEVWAACRLRKFRLRADLVAWIGARVAEGLHHAHELCDEGGALQNLVHRDVNPSNVFITYDGHVKLIDFGLVKAVRKVSQTAIGVVKGKLAYLSPEQIAGHVIDRRSDIFSLGATLWELSADQRLFKRNTDVETVNAIREGHVPDPTASVPDYPSLLWLVLQRALAHDRDQRYATALELARDLDGVARAQGSILQSATLAETMGELFGHERMREAARLRSASADADLAKAPAIERKDERPATRRLRSAYLIPTSNEPSLPPTTVPVVAEIPRRPRFRVALGVAATLAALLALLTAVVMLVGWLRGS